MVKCKWQLFSLDRTVDIVVGISQIFGALLTVINRTASVGALMLLPVPAQIFLVDVAFTGDDPFEALPIRLTCMVLSDLLVLYYYKERMILVWQNLTRGTTTKFKYKWWVFILLPLFGFLPEFAFGLLTALIKVFIYWLKK